MHNSRKGFSLLLAIIVMITIATLMAFMISLSTTTAKQTTDIYAHNNSVNCINNINFTFEKNYEVNMSLYYIGNDLPSSCNTIDNNISTPESNGTVIIDTYVDYNGSSEPIRYHRRTIQKP